VAVAARRQVVRQVQERGLSERQALRLVGMSPSTLRYRPSDDGNGRLRERLTELAGQQRRQGYRMLQSRLRIDGWAINVKRTYRVYREEGLMVRKRRRKKLPIPERQPLVRPMQPDEVWSMDFSMVRPRTATRCVSGGAERLAFIYPACRGSLLPILGLHDEAARTSPD
jgi:transposase InsO family protein